MIAIVASCRQDFKPKKWAFVHKDQINDSHNTVVVTHQQRTHTPTLVTVNHLGETARPWTKVAQNGSLFPLLALLINNYPLKS